MSLHALTRTLKTFLISTTCIVASCVSLIAFAMGLDEAKQSGLIGEQANGYLGVVTDTANPSVADLVADINKKRKSKYEEIAKSKDAPLAQVEKQSGEMLIKRTQKGHYINTGGGWQKK